MMPIGSSIGGTMGIMNIFYSLDWALALWFRLGNFRAKVYPLIITKVFPERKQKKLRRIQK